MRATRAKWARPCGPRADFLKSAANCIRLLCLSTGLLTAVMAMLAFTSVPYYAYRWLGTHGGLVGPRVDLIILLSGSGMPSGPELMRCHQAAVLGDAHPNASVILMLPLDSALENAMRSELHLRGVAQSRVSTLHGRNTREQALDAAAFFKDRLDLQVALVTSPEHMYRSLRSFRKVGFSQVQGAPAFENALFSDLQYDHREIGGTRFAPDISGSYGVRYNFWNYLKLEITCLREYVALAYYRLSGWI